MSEEVRVKSPCVSICLLGEDDICCGCHRSGEEITRWATMPDAERSEILDKARARSKQGNPFASD